MAELRPAYLIHGDDHGAVAERRARLRALAEGGDGGGVELIEGERATPAAAAQALAEMTLAVGRRVIIVDGVERWRESDVAERLAPAMAHMPPDTTIALFAREEARTKAPAAVHVAVEKAGGQVAAHMTAKPWELPGWVREQGARMGLRLDAAAAKALVALVGDRQQRLLRELEKLALEGELTGVERSVDAQEVERLAARSVQWRAYALADALLARDRRLAVACYVRLREQGERPAGLVYVMAQRLRDALAVAVRLRAGESPAAVRRGLRMPARAAERFLADVARNDPERLREALATLADLELDSRGGAPIAARRGTLAGMSEDTIALRAIETITG